MPIEIRELVIRVAVEENNNKKADRNDQLDLTELKNKIVKECMQNIMLKIENLSER